MGLCQGLSPVKGAKERVISQGRWYTQKWQCMAFLSPGLVLRGSEDYQSSSAPRPHSAPENEPVWNLSFSKENIWNSPCFRNKCLAYPYFRRRSVLRACIFWFIVSKFLWTQIAVRNLHQILRSGLSYSGWQMGFCCSFVSLWILKVCSFPLFSQCSTRKESRGLQMVYSLLSGCTLSTSLTHSWSPRASSWSHLYGKAGENLDSKGQGVLREAWTSESLQGKRRLMDNSLLPQPHSLCE